MWVPISEYGLLTPAPYKYLIVAYSPDIAIQVASLLNIPRDRHIYAKNPDRIRGRRPPTYRIVVEFGWVYNKPQWTVIDREIDAYLRIWNVSYPNTIRTISLDQEHGVINRDILPESERPIWMTREHVPSSFRR